MTRYTPIALILVLFTAASFSACKSGTDDAGPNIEFSDSGVPDAKPAPDAFVCTKTECGSACVDISNDPLNCGGCGMACASAGMVCTGSLPCSCPADFVPDNIGGVGDMLFNQQGTYLAISPVTFGPLNIALVAYGLDQELNVAVDLAESAATLAPPSIALGYDVDTQSFTAASAYAAVEGALTFEHVCADGAKGTVTDVTFAEVEGIMNPTPVEGGCSQQYAALTFDIGSCPDPGDDQNPQN